MGRIIIKKGDITKEEVDVIVNAANTRLAGGGGVDGAIHRAAGPSVMEECRRIGGCRTGDAVITDAGMLPSSKIIHTPGPVWKGGGRGEPDLLEKCYLNSFEVALNNGLATIAFPSISTGVYGYPISEASVVAIRSGMCYVDKFEEIRYICFSDSDLRTYIKAYEECTGHRYEN